MAHCSEWFNRKAYFSLFSNVGGTVCFITEDVAVKYDFLNKKCVCVCGGGGGGGGIFPVENRPCLSLCLKP